jgi:hypothetical protein
MSFFPDHQCGAPQESEVCGGVSGAASAFIFEQGGITRVMVLIFNAPSIAYLLQDFRRWFSGATANVNALAVGLFAGFLLRGLSINLGDRLDMGEVYLSWSDADVTHTSDVYTSMAELWVCV